MRIRRGSQKVRDAQNASRGKPGSKRACEVVDGSHLEGPYDLVVVATLAEEHEGGLQGRK